jgi:hypothetical protein
MNILLILLILLVLLLVWGIIGLFIFHISPYSIRTCNNLNFTIDVIKHGPFVWLWMIFLIMLLKE